MINTLCVFCGSRTGASPEYVDAANSLGAALARDGRTLVYGGASVGVMGALADSTLAGGGKVVGVMPHSLARKEIAHGFLTEFISVGSMHERKALMEKKSDGFIVLPGGFGTFDETFEIITWAQLGMHHKPVGFLNVRGFFDPLVAMVQRGIDEGFIPPEHSALLILEKDVDALLRRMDEYKPPPPVNKWKAPAP